MHTVVKVVLLAVHASDPHHQVGREAQGKGFDRLRDIFAKSKGKYMIRSSVRRTQHRLSTFKSSISEYSKQTRTHLPRLDDVDSDNLFL